MKCVCGATVPLHNDVSLCETCLNAPPSEGFYRRHPDDVDDYDVDDEDVDACYMDQDDREDDDGPFERWDSENDA